MKNQISHDYDVIIVGAGHAGLGCAAALADSGLKPLVIEQHNLPGGLATSFVRGRFEFEPSMHLIPYGSEEKPSVYRKFWTERLNMSESFMPIPDSFYIAYTDDDGVDQSHYIPTPIPKFIEKIEEILPGSNVHLANYFNICKNLAQGLGYFASGKMDPDVLNHDYPVFVEYQGLTVDEAYEKMAMPQKIRDFLDVYWFYFGLGNAHMPSTISAMCLLTMNSETAYMPKHRSHGITAELEKVIREKGGDIWLNTKVEKILVENKKAIGVELENGQKLYSQHIVSNANPDTTYRKLISPKSDVPKEALKLYNSKKMGPSYFVVYLGLDVPYTEIGILDYHHFLSESFDTNLMFDATFELKAPMSQGSLCYNVAIPDFSPEGTCVIGISALIQGEAFKNVKQSDYQKTKEKIADQLIHNFEKRTGFQIRDHIEEIEIATPITFAHYCDLYQGAVLSYEYTDLPLLRAITEPQEQFFDNLTLVGAFTSEGVGYKNSIKGGKIGDKLATIIKEEHNHESK